MCALLMLLYFIYVCGIFIQQGITETSILLFMQEINKQETANIDPPTVSEGQKKSEMLFVRHHGLNQKVQRIQSPLKSAELLPSLHSL